MGEDVDRWPTRGSRQCGEHLSLDRRTDANALDEVPREESLNEELHLLALLRPQAI